MASNHDRIALIIKEKLIMTKGIWPMSAGVREDFRKLLVELEANGA